MGTSRLDCCSKSSAFCAVKLGGQVLVGTLSHTCPCMLWLLPVILPSRGAATFPVPVNGDCFGSTLSFSKHTVAAAAGGTLERPYNTINAATTMVVAILGQATLLNADAMPVWVD